MTATETVTWREAAVTLALGCAGGVVFWLVGFPMPFLTGPAMAVSLAAFSGVAVGMPPALRTLCFLVIGLSIGAGVTPEVLATAAQWPLSLALLAGLIVLSLAVSMRMLERVFGFDRATAFLAATPGHLSFVLGLSAERGVAVDRIAVVQSIRVLLLTVLVPIPLVWLGVDGGAAPGRGAPMRLDHFGVLLILSFGLGLVFQRLNIPAAFLLAAMAVSAVGHGSNLTPGAPASGLATGAFIIMGSLIGTRFRGVSWAQLVRDAGAGAAVTVLASAIALAGAFGLAWAGGYDPLLLFVAYAPGGVEAMAAISVQLGLASAVVAAHHVTRLVILSVLVPVMLPKTPDGDREGSSDRA